MSYLKYIKKLLKENTELLFWITGLILLFFMNTAGPEQSLCFFRFIGFEKCPGCGLGHAIKEALHFHLTQSFDAHFMGIPAILIILHRIVHLSKKIKKPVYEI